MKTNIIRRLAGLLALGSSGLALVHGTGVEVPQVETSVAMAPLSMAVFDFQTTDRSLEKKGGEVATLLNAKLSLSPDVFLVERQEVEKILGEQELGLSGAITPESVAKVGALVGAKVLVTGRLFEAGGKTYLVAKIMSSETGRVFGEMATIRDAGSLEQGVDELSEKIVRVTTRQAGALVAKAEDPSARLGRLKAAVAGKTLPAVFVSIAEQHLGRPVIDPAAQTEFQLVLKQVGFAVLSPDEAAARTEVVVISGEAFSELGLRRGNLVSCRARVEITVTERATKKLLLADRQMDVAVDLAEHVAGKKALENAALKLLDRLVPLLAR